MSPWLRNTLLLLVVIMLAGWWLTAPSRTAVENLPAHAGDVTLGERVFWAGGCASCHASPVDGKRAQGQDKLLLGGGLELDTPYGVFRVPNISPHEQDGIGAWSTLDFINAMRHGVSPRGTHYYPSFPYTSYARMPLEDLIDLEAYLRTLPLVDGRVADHELGFPWSVRRGLGLWKRLYLDDDPVADIDMSNSELVLGQKLVEGAGHCGECHTPRNRFGALLHERWLAGAPNPEGKGRIPNITMGSKNLASWSARDLEYYFESGFTPEFDTVGGSMVAVQENLAMLSAADRAAIAAYLKAITPVQ